SRRHCEARVVPSWVANARSASSRLPPRGFPAVPGPARVVHALHARMVQRRSLGRSTSMPYDVFLSYSHAADGRLAPALQSGLQRFARPWNRLHALRVFRDQSGLAANPGLWSAIEAALNQSAYFILLASPASARSAWVHREVRHWIGLDLA